MASLNDYKRHIQVLKIEQKIGRIQKELETVDYGDECPLHGENDCAEVRKAYNRGYVSGLYEALTLFKLIEADTPQTECDTCRHYKPACELFSEICKYEPTTQNSNLTFETDTPQTDCEACELDGKADVCKICRVSNYEPQTDYPWK